MAETASQGWQVRRVAYFLLAVAAALVTSSPDPLTMLGVFGGGIILFELGWLGYRFWHDPTER